MKTKRFLLFTIVFVIIASFTIVPGVLADKDDDDDRQAAARCAYCGELELGFFFTENDHGTLPEPETGALSFYFVDTGGPFFIVHGILDPVPSQDDTDDMPILLSGTCQVCEDCIENQSTPILFCNLYLTQEHAVKLSPAGELGNWFDGRMMQISLDLITLEGNVFDVGTDYKRVIVNGEFDADASYFDDGYAKGTVNVVGRLPGCLRRYAR